MDWWQPIDRYCERLAPGLWEEPFNLLSNLAFFAVLVAALWRWHRRGSTRMPLGLRSLFVLLVAVGVGSSLFHSASCRGTELADVIPIGLFVLSAWGLVMRNVLGWNWVAVAFGYGFLAAATALGFLVPATWFNGSNGYFGAMATLVLAAWLCRRNQRVEARWLWLAVPLFVLALVCRTIDQAICADFKVGTHFLWHGLVAGVAGLLLFAVVDALTLARRA